MSAACTYVEKMAAADGCEDDVFIDAILTQDLVTAGQEVLAVEDLLPLPDEFD